MIKFLLCVSACAFLGACATDPTSSTDKTGQKEYRTGSNLPSRGGRDGVVTVSSEELERMRNSSIGTGPGRSN